MPVKYIKLKSKKKATSSVFKKPKITSATGYVPDATVRHLQKIKGTSEYAIVKPKLKKKPRRKPKNPNTSGLW